jgi:hypothetical protein
MLNILLNQYSSVARHGETTIRIVGINHIDNAHNMNTYLIRLKTKKVNFYFYHYTFLKNFFFSIRTVMSCLKILKGSQLIQRNLLLIHPYKMV